MDQQYPVLQKFFDTVVWYGTPFVEEFLNQNSESLRFECNKSIWEKNGIGFKSKAHIALLHNDLEYLLAYICYRFAEPGNYSFVIPIYENEINDNYEALTLLKIWLMTNVKARHCFTIFGISVDHFLSEKELSEYSKFGISHIDGISSRLARIILGIDFINKNKKLGIDYKHSCEMLGFDPYNWLNSHYCDGIN